MGWANCGEDSRGRSIGYAHHATCDHPECDVKINRGLGYACGDMHGDDWFYCEKYFCEKHLHTVVSKDDDRGYHICKECMNLLILNDHLEIIGTVEGGLFDRLED